MIKITDNKEVKVGDFIYSSYWDMVDKVVAISETEYGRDWKVKQVTPINPGSIIDVESVGSERCHSTSMVKDSIMTKEEVISFVKANCCQEATEAVWKNFGELG